MTAGEEPIRETVRRLLLPKSVLLLEGGASELPKLLAAVKAEEGGAQLFDLRDAPSSQEGAVRAGLREATAKLLILLVDDGPPPFVTALVTEWGEGRLVGERGQVRPLPPDKRLWVISPGGHAPLALERACPRRRSLAILSRTYDL